MADEALKRLALLYDAEAFAETTQPAGQPRAGLPRGIPEHQTVTKTFLDALLAHGNLQELIILARNPASQHAFAQLTKSAPAFTVQGLSSKVIADNQLWSGFFPSPPAPVLHFPRMPEARFAWARHLTNRHSFSATGFGLALTFPAAVDSLNQVVTTPWEEYDALIFPSRAALHAAREVLTAYGDYLNDRLGGKPQPALRMEVIPTGFHAEGCSPARSEQRLKARLSLGVKDGELVVVSAGQLSLHARAHPFPMLRGLAQAARNANKKVVLLLAGWAVAESIIIAFREAARVFAPNVRTEIVDTSPPEKKEAVWHAADLFTLLTDSAQEFHGLSVLQAMAYALPVVATDWGPNKEFVQDGVTGYLVPTHVMKGGISDAFQRMMLGTCVTDAFLAELNQVATVVDLPATVQAYERLLGDYSLRQRLGAAGRNLVLERFSWQRVIEQHRSLWQELDQTRRKVAGAEDRTKQTPIQQQVFPSAETFLSSYATGVLDDGDRVQTVPDAEVHLLRLQGMTSTSYAENRRRTDQATTRAILDAAAGGCSIGELDQLFAKREVSRPVGRGTIAWMLRYGFLRLIKAPSAQTPPGKSPKSGTEVR
jgi:glycosyltransferase involved in cell wall biosynthesis